MSYQAIVAKIQVRDLPGSDNLQLGSVLGYNVIVGKEVDEGERVVFFEQGGALSEEFAQVNDLVRRKDENGNAAGGFFEENRRVKALKLRGAISEGFVCSLDKFAYTGVDLTKEDEGFQFDELNGHKICARYETPATRRAQGNQVRSGKADNPMFKKHIDTEQLKRAINMIPSGAHLIVTEKLHGTSHRMGHVMEEVPIERNWWQTFLNRFMKEPETEWIWKHVHGTRNVELTEAYQENIYKAGYYGSNDFRNRALRGVVLAKGECVYGELVGYTDLEGKSPIQKTTLSGLKDKKISEKFGEVCNFLYKCVPGEVAFYVYRITQVNEDGVVTELSWNQVVKRCAELGLVHVPFVEEFFYEGSSQDLTNHINTLVNGESGTEAKSSSLDLKTISEGVVVRVESTQGTHWYKEKSVVFKVAEGLMKEDETAVDIEEAS